METLALDPNRYSNPRLIGKGLSGSVYAIYDKERGEDIACKMIDFAPRHQRAVIEFEREITIMAKVAHPTIVGLISFIKPSKERPNVAHIFTEYMSNGSLESVLIKARDGEIEKLDNTTKMIILYGVAVGMNHIHSMAVIHRDLKPGNVLIDSNFYPRITDFGLSKITSISETQSTFCGTTQWMAPEILVEDSYYSFPVDVYAFSMIIFEVISGQQPFSGKTAFAIMSNVMSDVRPEIPKDFPPAWRDLMIRCWDQVPNKRPSFSQIVEELADEKYILDGTDIDKFMKYKEFISAPLSSREDGQSIIDQVISSSNYVEDYESIPIFRIEQIRKLAYGNSNPEEKSDALVNYGIILEEGNMLPVDNNEAARCFKKAADLGNSLALYKYGHVLEYGIGVEKDLVAARQYYKLSADAKNADGIQAYAYCILNGVGGPQDVDAGIKLYKEAAKTKHAKALYNLGLIYLYGKFVPMNIDEAKVYLKQAVDLGYMPALIKYGKLLDRNNEQERKEALDIFKRAADSGNPEAEYQLGVLYEQNGEIDEAAAYFKKSAEAGNSNGQLKYAYALSDGNGVPLNKSMAAEFFKQSANQGNYYAMLNYGKMLVDGVVIAKNVDEGIRFLNIAAEKLKQAKKLLGIYYFKGEDVKKDWSKAATYLDNKDIYSDDLEVIRMLEMIYRDDHEKAVPFYYLGAMKNDKNSQFLYGLCNFLGKGIKKNEQAGLKLITLAAENNCSEACFFLADYYEKKKNLKFAIPLYKKAASLGNVKAIEYIKSKKPKGH